MEVLSRLYPDRTVRAISLFLLSLGVMLVVGHVFTGALNEFYPSPLNGILRDFFALNQEANAPTWFSSLQLALIAVVCGVLFLGEKAGGSPARDRVVWLGFSLLFLLLSLDEAAQVHERLDQVVDILWKPAGGVALGQGMDTATIYFYLLLYIPVLGVVSFAIIGSVSHRVMDRATHLLFVTGLLGCIMKLGFELIEPVAEETIWLGHHVMVEIVILQMYALILGETLILTALLNYLATLIDKPSLRSRVIQNLR